MKFLARIRHWCRNLSGDYVSTETLANYRVEATKQGWEGPSWRSPKERAEMQRVERKKAMRRVS